MSAPEVSALEPLPIPAANPSLRVAAQQVLCPFLLSRVWITIFVYLGHTREDLGPVGRIWPGIPHWWLNAWTNYDSEWFLRIAGSGYEPTTTAFFPLYPLLLRLAGTNEVAIALWGVILSNILFFIGLVYFLKLTSLDHNAQIAQLAVWLLCFFPTTMYFSAVYTESLFLLCIVATFYCVRINSWAGAGCWALLASLTKNSGPLIFAALCLEYFQKRQSNGTHASDARQGISKTALLVALLPLLGFVVVQGYFVWKFGGLTAGIESQKSFGRALGWPWVPVVQDFVDIVTLRGMEVRTLLHFTATILAFFLLVRHARRQPWSYSVLIFGTIMMHLTYGLTLRPHTFSAARYMMTTFPFVQMLAKDSQVLTRPKFRLVLAATVYLLICALMSFVFGVRASLA